MKEYLCIGQVVKPQGVRGEIKVLPLTDDVERFLDLARVFLRADGGASVLRKPMTPSACSIAPRMRCG